MIIYKKVSIFLCLFLFAITSFAQSLTNKSIEELEIMKKEAVASENYELAKKIKKEQNDRKTFDDRLKDLNIELAGALKIDDFSTAEKIKAQIKEIEAKKVQLKKLEEDKNIAIFQERFDAVITLEQEITTLKTGKSTPIISEPKPTITPTPIVSENILESLNTITTNKLDNAVGKNNSTSSEYDYNDKILQQIGYGYSLNTQSINEPYWVNDSWSFSGGYYVDNYVSYDSPVHSISVVEQRWWIKKYLVGGWFADFAFGEEGAILGGAQISALATIAKIYRPYISLGTGYGYDGYDGEMSLPINLKIGHNLFFSKSQKFGIFFETNITFNYESLPMYRIGVVWNSIKHKAKNK